MTASLLEYRCARRFEDFAEFAVQHGLAVGIADETGRPLVLASITAVERCEPCGQDMPAGHRCKPLETPR